MIISFTHLNIKFLVVYMESKFHAFMAAIPHEHLDFLVDTLQEYSSVSEYLIARETSATAHKETLGQHFHFLVMMNPTDYKNFSERIFRKKFSLRGQAKKGLPRQYGKIREIIDLERMGAYTCKDGDITTNMPDARIKAWAEASFKRDEERTFREKVFEYLDKEPDQENEEYKLAPWVQYKVLEYFREFSEKTPNRNSIVNITTQYMLHHCPKNQYSIKSIMQYLRLD